MTTDRNLAVVVEPPLNVANSLMEEVRRLAARFRETDGSAVWGGPDHYAAVILRIEGDEEDTLDKLKTRLNAACRNVKEFGVRLKPLELEEDGDRGAFVVSKIESDSEALAGLAEEMEKVLSDIALETGVETGYRIPVAFVTGEDNVQAMRESLDARETPVAGWLLGGICLAGTEPGPSEISVVNRVDFIPLSRPGSRRR